MFKMVFVINTSLKMKPGKLASQTAHAAVSLYVKSKSSPKKHLIFFNEIDTWLVQGQKKIVLKGLDTEQLLKLEKQAQESRILTALIRDAGNTHLTPGSLTCLGLFGSEEEINRVTGSLNLYN